MLEKDFVTRLNRWLKHYATCSMAVEAKITKTNRIAFARLEQHQELALLHAKNSTLVFKPSDASWDQKPCDTLVLRMVPAYVAVMFYTKRGDGDHFYLIPIDEWISLRQTKSLLNEKSFTEADCRGEWLRTLQS